MSEQELEKLASKNEPMPNDLTAPQIMLFQSLSALYSRYQLRAIDSETAKEEKRLIMAKYRIMNDDYKQFLDICKMYQEKLRGKYQ